MKKLLFILFLFFSNKAIAPDIKIITIFKADHINIYEKLIRAVIHVESGGNNFAHNILEDAYGAFQIRPIRLLDFNQRTGKKYLMQDCYNYEISKEIFLYYAMKNPSSSFESISRNWNGSGEMTIDYWRKVSACLY